MLNVIEHHVSAGMDLEQKLARSKEGMQTRQLRTIRCPSCGFYLLDVAGHDHSYVRVKCRKCKFNEVIDTALFRTLRYRSYKKNLIGGSVARCAYDTVYSLKHKR